MSLIGLSTCRKKLRIPCPKCGEEISLDECFKDKAAENELKTATIKCTNQDCPWEGPGKYYKVNSLYCNCVYIRYSRMWVLCHIHKEFPVCAPPISCYIVIYFRSNRNMLSLASSPELHVPTVSMAVQSYC